MNKIMEPECMISPRTTCAMAGMPNMWGEYKKNGEVTGTDHKGPLYTMLWSLNAHVHSKKITFLDNDN